MENKIFTETLPKNGYGIDWSKCKNQKVRFVFNDIDDVLCISDIVQIGKHPIIEVTYKDKTCTIHTNNFTKCKISKLLGYSKPKFKHNIDDVVNGLLITKQYYKVLIKTKNNKEYNINEKFYKYKCTKCGYKGEKVERSLNKEGSCPVCNNKKVIKGINDIATTHKYLIKYFVNKEDAYDNTIGSDNKVKLKCPLCGNIKNTRIADLKRYGFTCICGDGYSYSEKFLHEMFKQLNTENIPQLSRSEFKWCEKYRYDYYLSEYNWIIEANGEQHYKHSFIGCGGRTLEEEQENDILKENIALENGISKYIKLDCRKSEKEFIKNSVINSELKDILDFSKVDWNKCHEFATNNLVKEICDMWNKYRNVTAILNDIKTISSRTTAIKYLKQGSELGWCDYNPKKKQQNNNRI